MSNDQIQIDPQTPAEEEAPATLLYDIQESLDALSGKVMTAIADNSETVASAAASGHGGFLVMGLTIFVLACFVGYYVVWKVTPALHSPLMGITNAISSVIIVGAILAAGPADGGVAKLLGFLGITLASVNIFGGFIITRRMLSMFKKKGA